MKIGIDPTVDIVFKKLFGSEENKALLIELINAVHQESGQSKVVEVQMLNPYNIKEFQTDKLSIVDVKARNETGEWFIVEVQLEMSWYFPKRLVYYWSKIYQSQIKAGEKYGELKKATLICIAKESLPVQTKRYYSHFQILEVQDRIPLCDDLHIHTIELSKFLASEQEIAKPIEQWAYFLKHGENLDDENLPERLQAKGIQQAAKELTVFTKDEIEREIYEAREKAIRDYNSIMHDKYQQGRKEGELKGIEMALEIKFGTPGLKFMEQIQAIQNLQTLNEIQTALKKAKDVNEFQATLAGVLSSVRKE